MLAGAEQAGGLVVAGRVLGRQGGCLPFVEALP